MQGGAVYTNMSHNKPHNRAVGAAGARTMVGGVSGEWDVAEVEDKGCPRLVLGQDLNKGRTGGSDTLSGQKTTEIVDGTHNERILRSRRS